MRKCSCCGALTDKLTAVVVRSVGTKQHIDRTQPLCPACCAWVIMEAKKFGIGPSKPELPFLSGN